jgi:hypothetical protein
LNFSSPRLVFIYDVWKLACVPSAKVYKLTALPIIGVTSGLGSEPSWCDYSFTTSNAWLKISAMSGCMLRTSDDLVVFFIKILSVIPELISFTA